MQAQIGDVRREMIISIVRGVPSGEIVPAARALLEGGVRFVEVAFVHDSPEGTENTLRSIELLEKQLGNEMYIGAGTVLTPGQAELARERGAGFVISPNTDTDVIRKTKELGMLSMPGAMTPTEAVTAWEAGADAVKLFPAGDLGASYMKALMAPLSHIFFAAVGGIGPGNIGDFYRIGIRCFGIGGSLVSRKLVSEGDFARITENARRLRALTC